MSVYLSIYLLYINTYTHAYTHARMHTQTHTYSDLLYPHVHFSWLHYIQCKSALILHPLENIFEKVFSENKSWMEIDLCMFTTVYLVTVNSQNRKWIFSDCLWVRSWASLRSAHSGVRSGWVYPHVFLHYCTCVSAIWVFSLCHVQPSHNTPIHAVPALLLGHRLNSKQMPWLLAFSVSLMHSFASALWISCPRVCCLLCFSIITTSTDFIISS